MRTIWLDMDAGTDDAIALLTALRLPDLTVRGASAVAGNAPLSDTFRNVRDLLYYGGREDIPVYPGCERPLAGPRITASHVHGDNGLCGVKLAASPAQEETQKAWDAVYEAAKERKGELELIATGPLTNVALLIVLHPDIRDLLKRILIMGGGVEGGNITPAAEFNIYADPEAADIVFRAGIPLVMCGLDVTMRAYLGPEESDEIEGYGTPRSVLFRDLMVREKEFHEKMTGRKMLPIHDVCPVLYAVYPEHFRSEKAYVRVVREEGPMRGATVADLKEERRTMPPNAEVVLDTDRAFFAEQIRRTVLEQA